MLFQIKKNSGIHCQQTMEKAMAGNPLKYPCLENPMDGGALQAAVHGVAESDATEQIHFHFSLSMRWRRKWQPTPVFLPVESQGPDSLMGCHLWGHTELDTTEMTQQKQHQTADARCLNRSSSKKKKEKLLFSLLFGHCEIFVP